MSIQAADRLPLPSVRWAEPCLIPVRWGDLDAMDHVNNTVYFRYFEEARVRLLAGAGVFGDAGRGAVLAQTSCDFLKPVQYPATVVIRQGLVRIGRSSLEAEVVLELDGEPGVAYARGRYVVVGSSRETGKSMPWTEAEIRRLEQIFQSG
ncbi:acyl-CoA thioesterase [Parapusillimonas granuli]|uniref:Acyl-CoA thioesterase n=1 Tax=Parapusillimonas granuli TaxID=380911 RepID=A0A853FZK9_9BURK|nr:thioesterase family protein [Parapusillimonas granuli]MBB5216802.1 acyl-CoA thioester hydrolase [Parapusillimonas granuli]MEB2400131.1 thioesterase family protein [Alcaligenaceae bacterium]NYT51555.1 acyl-CoA thioesterase [Parapusillimonas granuli]